MCKRNEKGGIRFQSREKSSLDFDSTYDGLYMEKICAIMEKICDEHKIPFFFLTSDIWYHSDK